MSRCIVVKAGTTFPNTARKYGDFEHWTRHGLGLAPDQVGLFDALTGQTPPAPDDCLGVVVTGSHAMVTNELAWSERLVEWIASLLESRTPILGICYGHQLLAKAAGGIVGYHPRGKEIGTVDINLLPECATDPLFHNLPDRFPVHATHSQSVLSLPAESSRLASNSFENCHAIRVGDCAWGVQFHPEYDSRIMTSYIEEQNKDLEAAGIKLTETLDSVRDTPESASLLRRFATLCELGQSA